jgi:3-oxoacyl-[acyl-carrier protein] reductase
MPRVVVVTGASKGVGKLIADHFRELGDTVVDASRSTGWDVGTNAVAFASYVQEQHGRCDVLINNAGVGPAGHSVMLPESAVEEAVRTNLLGTFYMSREIAKLMRPTGGRIVNIGSIHTALEPVGASIYAATKAANATLAGIMAKEYARWGITVNTIGLSSVDTEMYRSLSPERQRTFVEELPIPRLATADDIFNVIDFFVSSASSFITGQTLYLGGVR